MKADRGIGIGRIPAQQDALLADLGSQAGNRRWRFAGQNGGGIGGARGTTIAVVQFDEIDKWTGSADGQRGRESLGECAIGGGRELELACFRGLAVDAFAATERGHAILSFRGSLSVLRLGMVQVRDTWFPTRVAERSVTRSGRLSDGGCGAPGVPHPERHAHRDTISAAASRDAVSRCASFIGIQDKGRARAQNPRSQNRDLGHPYRTECAIELRTKIDRSGFVLGFEAAGFHAVAADFHIAPAAGVILAGIEEQPAAVGLFAGTQEAHVFDRSRRAVATDRIHSGSSGPCSEAGHSHARRAIPTRRVADGRGLP